MRAEKRFEALSERVKAALEAAADKPSDTAETIAARITQARTAHSEWAALPFAVRSDRLRVVKKRLAEEADFFAELISRENGKTRTDALATEILPAVLAIDFYRKRGRRILRPEKARGGHILMFNKKSRLIRQAYGVIGIISPWNYPFAIPFSEVVMGLLAGNGVILKTASSSVAVGQALTDLFSDCALPEGLFAYIKISGAEAGPAFISGGIDKLFFTGSTAVGKKLMALASERLLPLVLELGGADAAIVRRDADLVRAASGIAWAAFANAGQSCGGVQRVYVSSAVFRPFLEALAARTKALRVGPGAEWTSDIGPMNSTRQRDNVAQQIKACTDGGASVFARAGDRPEPSSDGDEPPYLTPMVLIDIPPDSPILTEEIFGPVIAVLPFDTDEQALELANASSYGLTGSIWSRDRRSARALASRLNAGAVTINDHLMSHGLAETPWGGYGASGLGRTHGAAGLMEMTKLKVVVDDSLSTRKMIWWFPYSEKVYDGLRALATFAASAKFGARLAAIPRVLGIFFRYWDKK